jgi:hypothetical protein
MSSHLSLSCNNTIIHRGKIAGLIKITRPLHYFKIHIVLEKMIFSLDFSSHPWLLIQLIQHRISLCKKISRNISISNSTWLSISITIPPFKLFIPQSNGRSAWIPTLVIWVRAMNTIWIWLILKIKIQVILNFLDRTHFVPISPKNKKSLKKFHRNCFSNFVYNFVNSLIILIVYQIISMKS